MVDVGVVAAFDFALAAALADPLAGVAVVLGVVGVAAAVPLDGAPVTVTTCAGGLLTAVLLPERPISTPIPIASRRIPITEMSVLFTGAVRRRGAGALCAGLS